MSIFTGQVWKHCESMHENLPEMFHADVRYRADVTSEERTLRLIVTDDPMEGWLCSVHYLDSKETIMLGPQYPTLEGAKTHIESWVRVVHNVSDGIDWIPGEPSNSEAARARS